MSPILQTDRLLPLPEAEGRFPFPLDPFQREAIAHLAEGRSVVVCAPTGAGKTVVGEYCVHAALHAGRRVFYTTPLKALSNQKFRDFGAQFGEEKVGLLTGDVTINRAAPVVVMTTEVFRNMLYAGRSELAQVQFVVLDECHYINDVGRGTVWEESVISCPPEIQLVALSATIANARELAGWLTDAHGKTELVYSEDRPVPLKFHYFDRELSDLLKKTGPGSRRPLIPRWQAGRGRGKELQPDPDEVLEALHAAQMLPAIYFVFSRRGCERALHRCAGLELLTEEEAERLETLLEGELERVPSLRYYPFLRELLMGLAVHHAGLLPSWKPPIERLFQAGLIKAVFATETLAAGINMPARTTVIAALSKRGDTGFRVLTANEFLQMSGRAGRRGIDTLGHVVVVADPFRAPAEAAELAAAPPDPLTSRFAPTYGMVLNFLRHRTPAQAETLLRKSFGQYLADQLWHQWREKEARKKPSRRKQLTQSPTQPLTHSRPTRSLYWNRFQALAAVLEEYGYLEDDRPTDRGLLAAALRVENELFVAEVVRSDLWEQLAAPGLAALFTAIITEDLRPDARVEARPDRAVNAALEQVRGLSRSLRRAQARRRADVPVRLNPIAAGLVELWTAGAEWETVTAATSMDEGDIVHLLRRLLDLLRQLPQAPGIPPRLAALATEAATAIDREPVSEVL